MNFGQTFCCSWNEYILYCYETCTTIRMYWQTITISKTQYVGDKFPSCSSVAGRCCRLQQYAIMKRSYYKKLRLRIWWLYWIPRRLFANPLHPFRNCCYSQYALSFRIKCAYGMQILCLMHSSNVFIEVYLWCGNYDNYAVQIYDTGNTEYNAWQ